MNAAAEATITQLSSEVFKDPGTIDKSKDKNTEQSTSVDVEKTYHSARQEECDTIEGTEPTFASPNSSSDDSRLRKCLGMLK